MLNKALTEQIQEKSMKSQTTVNSYAPFEIGTIHHLLSHAAHFHVPAFHLQAPSALNLTLSPHFKHHLLNYTQQPVTASPV